MLSSSVAVSGDAFKISISGWNRISFARDDSVENVVFAFQFGDHCLNCSAGLAIVKLVMRPAHLRLRRVAHRCVTPSHRRIHFEHSAVKAPGNVRFAVLQVEGLSLSYE